MARFFREVGRRLHLVAHEEPKAPLNHAQVETSADHRHLYKHHHHHHHHHNHHHNHPLVKRSDVEEEIPSALSRTQLKPNQLKEYKRLADKSWNMLWSYLHRPEADWKHESGRSEVDGLIHSMQTTDYGKVFRLQGYVEMSAKSLWEEMVHSINTAPSWNPTLEECHTVLTIDENTDISHNVAAGIGGLVSSRDFVSIRRWGQREGLYLSCGCSVDHPDWPETKKHVRGFNGPGGWVFKPVAGEPGKCIFIWFMNSDIKGWIPQRVMDQAMTSVLQDYLKYLRVHAATLRNSM